MKNDTETEKNADVVKYSIRFEFQFVNLFDIPTIIGILAKNQQPNFCLCVRIISL